MHLKNFSLMTEDWQNICLAPCYDLLSTRLIIPESRDPEELALPTSGKKRNIYRNDFVKFGKNQNIPEKVINASIKAMLENFTRWEEKIKKSFISEALKLQYQDLILKRISRFN